MYFLIKKTTEVFQGRDDCLNVLADYTWSKEQQLDRNSKNMRKEQQFLYTNFFSFLQNCK